MADRAVTQTRKDSSGDITHLCHPGSDWSPRGKWDVIADLEAQPKRHTYHVPWNNGRTEIRVVKDPSVSGGKYLRTDSDNTTKNNLDDLPDC